MAAENGHPSAKKLEYPSLRYYLVSKAHKKNKNSNCYTYVVRVDFLMEIIFKSLGVAMLIGCQEG